MAIRINLETIHNVASICEQGLTSASEISKEALTYCAVVWLNGKLLGKCSSSESSPQSCLEDATGLKTAIFTNLALMTFLALAITTKQVSSGLRHKTISPR
jgi:hypothetical protein